MKRVNHLEETNKSKRVNRLKKSIILKRVKQEKKTKLAKRSHQIIRYSIYKEGKVRNYFQVEKTEDGLFLSEGKGTPTDPDYDSSQDWHSWEKMENEEQLFERIKELLDK